jgi:DNA-directed RNA polymerase subunit RPC12/RpoP
MMWATGNFVRIGQDLPLETCPHCGVANPRIVMMWTTGQPVPRATSGPTQVWAMYRCTSCGGGLLVKGQDDDKTGRSPIVEIIPKPKEAHGDIPEPARTFLQQAYRTLHAPDAAVMVAGSAVDAMLKELGFKAGSVYARIEQAVEQHELTDGMGEWAHEVRLGSNRPRHADNEKPHVTADEAKQSVEFAEALGYFLFVLSKRVERGTEEARKASEGSQ